MTALSRQLPCRDMLGTGVRGSRASPYRQAVLPALIGMKDRLVLRTEPRKGAPEHRLDHFEQRPPATRLDADESAC